MLSSRWYKVINDLWGDKTRTLLTVLSIAVGLFAVGTIVSARSILSAEMASCYQAIVPSSGIVRTVEPFDEGFVRSVRAMRVVADADARRVLDVRARVGRREWMSLRLFAVDDYDRMRVDKIRPESGAWPPPERQILIERTAIGLLGAQVGDVLSIELPGERVRALRIAGLVHDMVQVPAPFDGLPYGYIAVETLEWFGAPHGFNELHIVPLPPAADHVDAKAHARKVVNEVKTKAEVNGLTIPLSLTVEPGMLPLDDILQAVLLLMGALGLLSLFLSVFLVVNTVSALLAQQRRQIGVMKAIGARSVQVMGMYLVMVTLYGLLALLIAVPASRVGAHELSRFMAAMFNFDLTSLEVPGQAVVLQAIVGLLVPVLSSLYPFLANLRITAAEAMRANYEMSKGRFARGVIDRLLAGANLWFARRVLMRSLLLSLRNTFRNKGRLALTLMTLTMAGAIFVGVFSVRASLYRTIDDLLRWWNFDAFLNFARPYRVAKIEQEALSIAGVDDVDVWFQLPVRRVRPDGSESGTIMLFAPYADSEAVLAPVIVEGRWLSPKDHNAIVVNAILLKEEPDMRVGDEIVLKVEGRERPFRVVGKCLGILAPMAYASYGHVARITGNVGQAGTVLVVTDQHDLLSVRATATAMEAHFDQVGLRVSDVQTMLGERAEVSASLGIVIALLLIMAVLLAVVGGLGLMGTMSINVLERRREIGVLRAIGASNRGVAQVFVLEGVIIGLLSWALGSLLALPLGRLLGDAVGVPLMGAPLSFSYSMDGAWIWLLLVALLSALASLIPARNASRLTVREILAYE
jgi:putative ABC transport system permease protein